MRISPSEGSHVYECPPFPKVREHVSRSSRQRRPTRARIVHGPRGLRIEGLELADVVELVRQSPSDHLGPADRHVCLRRAGGHAKSFNTLSALVVALDWQNDYASATVPGIARVAHDCNT